MKERKSKKFTAALLVSALLFLTSCTGADSADMESELNLTPDTKEASQYTAEINSAVYSQLDFQIQRKQTMRYGGSSTHRKLWN